MKESDLTWLKGEITNFSVDTGFSDKRRVIALVRAGLNLTEEDLPDDYGDIALWRCADIFVRQIVTRRQFTGSPVEYCSAKDFLGSEEIHVNLYVNLLMGIASEVTSATILVPPSDLEHGSGELPGVSDVLRDSIDIVVDPVIDVLDGVGEVVGDLVKDVASGLNIMTPLLIGVAVVAGVVVITMMSKYLGPGSATTAALPKEI